MKERYQDIEDKNEALLDFIETHSKGKEFLERFEMSWIYHDSALEGVIYTPQELSAGLKGGAIDAEAHRRGETLYGPGSKVPLHPPVLSEGAASLLPDGPRPALLWTIDLDSSGAQVSVNVERAMVRSRAERSSELPLSVETNLGSSWARACSICSSSRSSSSESGTSTSQSPGALMSLGRPWSSR